MIVIVRSTPEEEMKKKTLDDVRVNKRASIAYRVYFMPIGREGEIVREDAVEEYKKKKKNFVYKEKIHHSNNSISYFHHSTSLLGI